jgi:hypothetical protein
MNKTSFTVALGITGFVGWALFAEEPSQTSAQKVTTLPLCIQINDRCEIQDMGHSCAQDDMPTREMAKRYRKCGLPPSTWAPYLADERSRICTPGFAASIRPPESVTHRLKLRMMAAQGIPPWFAYLWRLDHIVPLELDGAALNPENLQLQRLADSLEKDKRENTARASYCAGELSLEEAQALFHRSGP